MPKIPEQVLRCAPYLYANETEAHAGRNPGGTGFLICQKSTEGNFSHHYCVSNHHVAVTGGFPCIRINRPNGSPEVFVFDNMDWYFLPGSDVAVVPLDYSRVQGLQSFLGDEVFLDDGKIKQEEIGPGDDVFMIGLFLDANAAETNLPAVRFGNISTSPIKIPISEYKDKMYCIDMHSRTGYSGSPVLFYRTPGSDLDWIVNKHHVFNGTKFGLLGVHTGQFPDLMPVVQKDKKGLIKKKEHTEYVKGLSGMTMVAPTQRILDTLKMSELKDMRAIEAETVLKNYQLPDHTILESAPRINENGGDKLLETMLNTPPKHTTKLHKKKTARR